MAMANGQSALKQGQTVQEPKTQTFEIDFHFSPKQFAVIKEAAKLEKLTVNEFLLDIFETYIEASLDDPFLAIMAKAWHGEADRNWVKPSVNKMKPETITVQLIARPGRFMILDFINRLTGDYAPSFIQQTILYGIRNHFEDEMGKCFEPDRMPTKIAARLRIETCAFSAPVACMLFK